MACRFLETLTLASLIAPASADEFRARYWETKPLIVHRNDPDYYDDIFTLEDFDDAIANGPAYVKVANDEAKKQLAQHVADTTRELDAVFADMRNGYTLVLDQIHRRDRKLGLLCRSLAPEFGHRLATNLYLTPPRGKGFGAHWDNHDVFILQAVGSKVWHLEKERRIFPGRGDSMGEEGRELQGEINTFTVKQGDLIYIPRGFVHAAECGEDVSLHITLGVHAAFFEEILYAAIKKMVQLDPRLRVSLPIGFMQDRQEGVVKRAMTAFLATADEGFLSTVVDQYRDELVQNFQLDVSGQVVEFFNPSPLSLDDVAGPRPGIVYRVHPDKDTVRLNFGARNIVFPGFFAESLEFALTTPAYAVREIKGDIQDEERIAFAERLIQEGLVVRKQIG
jgi:ribosomal protein L16 Arg81 hydroxylase